MVVGLLQGAVATKVRPAVVIASSVYLVERPDVLLGILTTKVPATIASTDHLLADWRSAGLRAPSCFRAYVLTNPSLGSHGHWPSQRPGLESGTGLCPSGIFDLNGGSERTAGYGTNLQGDPNEN